MSYEDNFITEQHTQKMGSKHYKSIHVVHT